MGGSIPVLQLTTMVVEVFLQKQKQSADEIPESLLELEMVLTELQLSIERLGKLTAISGGVFLPFELRQQLN